MGHCRSSGTGGRCVLGCGRASSIAVLFTYGLLPLDALLLLRTVGVLLWTGHIGGLFEIRVIMVELVHLQSRGGRGRCRKLGLGGRRVV